MTKDDTKTIANLVKGALTEIKAPSTKAKRTFTLYPLLKPIPEFDTFGDASLVKMLSEVSKFSADLNNTKPRWLSLLGDSGVGKTHLARAAYQHFMDFSRFNTDIDVKNQHIFGNTGQFVNWRKFCSDVREGCFGRIDDLCTDWFVVLDDIGSEHDPNGFIASAIDRILNERSANRRVGYEFHPKWTLITCNLPLAEIARKIDTRVASRMIRDGNVVVEVQTTDYALRKKAVAGL